MSNPNPYIGNYTHLKKLPRADRALHMLKSIASLVTPIMRKHGWHVKQLSEFYPEEIGLLGICRGHGKEICVRLRHPFNQNKFFETEFVLDTMLHELCHIVHTRHNRKFHALWNQLRDEWEALSLKGYTGEGFISKGQKVGGSKVPSQEKERRTRAKQGGAKKSREKRGSRTRSRPGSGSSSGHHLGGESSKSGTNLREAAAAAAEKRRRRARGYYAEDSLSEQDKQDLVKEATKNGFTTQAEEDEANDAAIAQALQELALEEEHGGEEDDGDVDSAFITPPAVSPLTRGSDVWECSICTLYNSYGSQRCGACETRRTNEDISVLSMLNKARDETQSADESSAATKQRQNQGVRPRDGTRSDEPR